MKKNTIYWIVIIIAVLLVWSGKINLSNVFSSAAITNEKILPTQYLNQPVQVSVMSDTSDIVARIDNIAWNATVVSSGVNGTYLVTVNNPIPGRLTIYAAPNLYKLDLKRPVIDIKDNILLTTDIGYETDINVQTLTPQGAALEVDSLTVKIVDPDSVTQTYTLTKTSGNNYKMHWKYSKSGIYYFDFSPVKPLYDTQIIKRYTNVMQAEPVDYFWYVMGAGVLVLIILIVRRRFFK